MIYARNSRGQNVHILNALKSETFYCNICNDEVRPHQGTVKPWHYRHKNNSNCIGNSDNNNFIGCVLNLNIQPDSCKAVRECRRNCEYR